MRSLLTAFMMGVGLLAASQAVAGDDVVTWKEDVKGWYIGVDQTTGDQGNGCFMSSAFEGGTFLRLQFDPNFDGGIVMFVGNEDWKSLEEGKIYPIEIQFGDQEPWTADAEGIVWNETTNALSISISLDNDATYDFINEFMRLLTIDFQYNGSSIALLNLSGTFAATLSVLECAEAMKNAEQPKSKDPFSNGSSNSDDPFS